MRVISKEKKEPWWLVKTETRVLWFPAIKEQWVGHIDDNGVVSWFDTRRRRPANRIISEFLNREVRNA